MELDKTSITFISVVRTAESADRLGREIARALPGIDYKTDFMLGRGSDSPDGETIFSGFTKAGKRATTDILCFLHDDVKILSNACMLDYLHERLQHKMTGVVGVAGTKQLGKDAVWWALSNYQERMLSGLVFHPDDKNRPDGPFHYNVYGPFGRVLVLDGVFFACRKDVFDKLGGFEVDYFENPGFDLYDIDFTWRASQEGYLNYTTPVMLLHGSPGEVQGRDSWDSGREDFIRKYRSKLPARI